MPELNWNSILKVAVKNDEQSHALYLMAGKKAVYSSSKKLLEELAKEELRHKEKLLGIIKDKKRLTEFGVEKIQDLRIVDEMEDTTLSQDANYQQILVYAAKREKSDYEYYSSMATGLKGTDFGDLFSKLAQEELKHKNRIEKEYDEYLMKEN